MRQRFVLCPCDKVPNRYTMYLYLYVPLHAHGTAVVHCCSTIFAHEMHSKKVMSAHLEIFPKVGATAPISVLQYSRVLQLMRPFYFIMYNK